MSVSSLDSLPAPSVGQPPRLLDELRQAALAHIGRPQPGQRFVDWARRFILFHDKRHPRDVGMAEVGASLTPLAVHGHVSACTPNQALNALFFFSKQVLDPALAGAAATQSAVGGRSEPTRPNPALG
jgi:hypothetical protein